MDFYKIESKYNKNGILEICPEFIVDNVKDLMVRGQRFYAIWNEEKGLWSTDEYDVVRIIDNDVKKEVDRLKSTGVQNVYGKYMRDFSSNIWNMYSKFVKSVPDNYHHLDDKIIFSNSKVTRKDYASKSLTYPLEAGDMSAYEELMSTLYLPEERDKLEWAIGAIISGDAKKIQKFIVLYGDAGAGKSTVLNIIEMLFDGYVASFDAKALTSNGNAFSTESFKDNPLIAIQHDGDLSRIEDNTKLNSIVSHEKITINEKHKNTYPMKMQCFLFMATNTPVKITNAKSGIIRRLIDVRPSGNKVPTKRYNELMAKIEFEKGAIAKHCLELYLKLGKNYYGNYKPVDMMYKTDPFFNYVEYNYIIFDNDNETTLKSAYGLYKQYCEEGGSSQMRMYAFREELKNYFDEFYDKYTVNGEIIRSYYKGFRRDKFESTQQPIQEDIKPGLVLDCKESIFDKECKDCVAQYANDEGNPFKRWSNVKTHLSELDTTRLHYVKLPENHIVIDFDIKENGVKSYEKNLEAASKWPATYAETSKSGAGIHLHYIYDGDVHSLSRLYDEEIEVKVFTGNSSLRRKLGVCNNLPIAHINSGLPLKGEKKVVNFEGLKNEKAIRTMIIKNLNREYHANTKPSVDYIYSILEDAYKSGMSYDVSDLYSAVYAFAASSSNQSDACLKLVRNMKFKSEVPSENSESDSKSDLIVFYDIEVFPNLFVLCWKLQGEEKKVIKMINPKPIEVESLLRYKLVGFNNRKYDNHILHAKIMGYSNESLFKLSQDIVENKKGFFGEAYNYSYSDIYDFASAGNKKGLKKFEIELGLSHVENEYPWDKPVPEDKWNEVADYCANDVICTEAVFNYLAGDWDARRILAKWSTMTCNDTTNNLGARIIFGKDKHPQDQFNYRDLSKPVRPENLDFSRYRKNKVWRIFDTNGEPTYTVWHPGDILPEGYSIMPFFPNYTFREEFVTNEKTGKTTYEKISSYEDVPVVGEGGYVYSEPSMEGETVTYDVAGEHPASISEEDLFGPVYTDNFDAIRYGRLAIKHKDFELAKKILPEVVHEYLDDISKAKGLSNAMKTVVNAAYGQTASTYECVFKDPRNKDNIVAKRGALFMIKLRLQVQARGFKVMHCKTDSIKIVKPTKEIEEFVYAYGKEFGYDFEIEHKFERICLVDKANYIAKLAEDDPENPGKWTVTGDKFAEPAVFKKIFTHEDITLDDYGQTKSVKTCMYLDFNEGLPEGEHSMIFVGRVGRFVPVKDGCGGGQLLRLAGNDKDGNPKYSAVEGTKGWRWKEIEIVKSLDLGDQINMEFYNQKIDDAIDNLGEFGDVTKFLSEDPYNVEEEVPWDITGEGVNPLTGKMNPPVYN